MSAWAISTAISILVAVLFVILFRHEERTGKRLCGTARLHLDFYVLKTSHAISHFVSVASSDLLRQVMHYTFHAVLGAALSALKHFEHRIHDIQRANRLRARASRSERTTRNKLDEIAEHKIAIALTEEEKRQRKEKHLLGK